MISQGSRPVGCIAVIVLALLAATSASAQIPAQPDNRTAAGEAISDLSRVTKELAEAVRRFQSHMDEAIASRDRGYRQANGQQIPAADADLTSGSAGMAYDAVRRLAAFRMLAARNEHYHPAPVADIERIEDLIAEAHDHAEASTAVLRRLLIVSVNDIDPRRDAEMKKLHDQLVKARGAAEEATREAWLTLPIDHPGAASAADGIQAAPNPVTHGVPGRQIQATPLPPTQLTTAKSTDPAAVRALHIEPLRRITLVNESSIRVALTDSGIEDANGRHLFYQEEWVQRGLTAIRLRWRVAIDTATGQHVLIKRYQPVELHGFLDDVYLPIDRDYLWYSEPREAAPPSLGEALAALDEVVDDRAAIRAAADDFRSLVHTSLARYEQRRTAAREPMMDAGLSDSLREMLFAIRAGVAGVPAIYEAEGKIWHAIEEAERAIAKLEPLAAWANVSDAADWEQILRQGDREIGLVRAAEAEVVASLPPDTSQPEAQFPALQKDIIVRIRRPSSEKSPAGLVRCLQEIWRMERSMPGLHEVRRTVTLVSVDPRTGDQSSIGGTTKYYRAAPETLLEEIYDENAADDLPLAHQ
jgi:hypothetical protein